MSICKLLCGCPDEVYLAEVTDMNSRPTCTATAAQTLKWTKNGEKRNLEDIRNPDDPTPARCFKLSCMLNTQRSCSLPKLHCSRDLLPQEHLAMCTIPLRPARLSGHPYTPSLAEQKGPYSYRAHRIRQVKGHLQG